MIYSIVNAICNGTIGARTRVIQNFNWHNLGIIGNTSDARAIVLSSNDTSNMSTMTNLGCVKDVVIVVYKVPAMNIIGIPLGSIIIGICPDIIFQLCIVIIYPSIENSNDNPLTCISLGPSFWGFYQVISPIIATHIRNIRKGILTCSLSHSCCGIN